jgi:hypothetical protein
MSTTSSLWWLVFRADAGFVSVVQRLTSASEGAWLLNRPPFPWRFRSLSRQTITDVFILGIPPSPFAWIRPNRGE